jgi:Phosphotransferase enzyme family.
LGKPSSVTAEQIHSVWRQRRWRRRLRSLLGKDVKLRPKRMTCLKDTFKSSVWRLDLKTPDGTFPVILKIFKPLKRKRRESLVEKKMYLSGSKALADFMPRILLARENVAGQSAWVFMERLTPLPELVQFHPDHFDRIIPTLAKLHACTFNEKFLDVAHRFASWLPHYLSEASKKERKRYNEKCKKYLELAMEKRDLHSLIAPRYDLLKTLLDKGPIYFPQVVVAGMSVVHSDLQIPNIAVCGTITPGKPWKIKFIDWEGARYAPCWFDMVNLVGIYLSYRTEWRHKEEQILSRTATLYASEMKKRGITFPLDPPTLMKMAFLQRILEKGLYLQLNWAVTGRKEAVLLSGFLQKIERWSRELRLI